MPGTAPYRQGAPAPYSQPVYQQPVRQVTTMPRPQIEPKKPLQPSVQELPPITEQNTIIPVDVPSPQQLGIRLDDSIPTTVMVPDPDKLGIKGD
jgi:hypothetical protein